MWGWLATWIGLIPAILGTVALVASGAIVAKSRVLQSTLEVLKENNEALTNKVARIDGELTTTTALVSALQQENALLRDLIQGRADLARLEALIVDHNETVMRDRKDEREARERDGERLHRDLQAILVALGRSG